MLRSDFINNFSHEFKTPIVSIAGFANLLRCGTLTKEQTEEYLAMIEENSSACLIWRPICWIWQKWKIKRSWLTLPAITSRNRFAPRGIGLAVVKKVVELHHGEISVRSENKATTFTVSVWHRSAGRRFFLFYILKSRIVFFPGSYFNDSRYIINKNLSIPDMSGIQCFFRRFDHRIDRNFSRLQPPLSLWEEGWHRVPHLCIFLRLLSVFRIPWPVSL